VKTETALDRFTYPPYGLAVAGLEFFAAAHPFLMSTL
jgi:hypothetical protein